MGGRRIVIDSDDDDDDNDNNIPSLRLPPSARTARTARQDSRPSSGTKAHTPAAKPAVPSSTRNTTDPKSTTVRRRKLGPLENDNSLLRPWSLDNERVKESKARQPQLSAELSPCQTAKAERRPRQRVEVRTRKTRRVSELPADDAGEISTEEATVLEDVALEDGGASGDETGNTADDDNKGDDEETGDDEMGDDETDDDDDDDDDASEFHDTSENDLSLDDSLADFLPSPVQEKPIPRPSKESNTRKKKNKDPSPPIAWAKQPADPCPDESGSVFFSADESFADALEKPMSHRSLDLPSKTAGRQETSKPARSSRTTRTTRTTTPPPSPPRKGPPRGLVSPTKKLPRIPMTPHRPNTDAFWDQQIVNDWNQEHSPRKLLFEPAGEKKKSSTGATTAAPSPKKAVSNAAAQERGAKKLFQKGKHETAEKFLAELDSTITNGELGRLAAATGGVRIVWTNKLNTTAGRANWRRETLRPRQKKSGDGDGDGDDGDAASADAASADTTAPAVRILHHASIELAEKVIDDEHRLLNVLAHEFCHLANFMVSGITGNPHGREFKAWAAQCSRHFGVRGIQVTTKHTYEIDFRYVWTCEACATQFKRHSKSIDPTRHRCGACRGELRQTKPVPRGGGGGGGGGSRAGAGAGPGQSGQAAPTGPPAPSAYQMFMKENMAVLRRENPGSPQKMIMKLVAERWTQVKEEKQKQKQKQSTGAKATADEASATKEADAGVARLHSAFVDLTLQ